MKTKRWNMGRHRCLLAKESMVSIGFDLHFPKCLEDDGETVARVWSLRLWVGPFIGLIQFNANAAIRFWSGATITCKRRFGNDSIPSLRMADETGAPPRMADAGLSLVRHSHRDAQGDRR